MQHPVLLGRDSGMRFKIRKRRNLARTRERCPLLEWTPSHADDKCATLFKYFKDAYGPTYTWKNSVVERTAYDGKKTFF